MQGQLDGWGCFNLKKEWFWGHLRAAYLYLSEQVTEKMEPRSSQLCKAAGQEMVGISW